jgi:hypothetical protein
LVIVIQEQRKTAKEQRAFRCSFIRRSVGGPGFLPKTRGGSLIISRQNSKNSENGDASCATLRGLSAHYEHA